MRVSKLLNAFVQSLIEVAKKELAKIDLNPFVKQLGERKQGSGCLK